MQIDRFIWLQQIVEKLLVKHSVSPEEVEEVFFNKPRFRFHEKGHVHGEDMYTVMGQTDTGRYIIAYFIIKPTNLALVISARDMSRKERRQYGQAK